RSYGDWSSDVCSSDLRDVARPVEHVVLAPITRRPLLDPRIQEERRRHEPGHDQGRNDDVEREREPEQGELEEAGSQTDGTVQPRSEERRVGKECREGE